MFWWASRPWIECCVVSSTWPLKTKPPSHPKGDRSSPTRPIWILVTGPLNSGQRLSFLDESGVNLAFVRDYARSERGKRAYSERPSRTKNGSVVDAISLKDGSLRPMQYSRLPGCIDLWCLYCSKLGPKLWKGAVVIMDNCSIHKSKEIIEALVTSFGATLIYLPPIPRTSPPLRTVAPK